MRAVWCYATFQRMGKIFEPRPCWRTQAGCCRAAIRITKGNDSLGLKPQNRCANAVRKTYWPDNEYAASCWYRLFGELPQKLVQWHQITSRRQPNEGQARAVGLLRCGTKDPVYLTPHAMLTQGVATCSSRGCSIMKVLVKF